MTWKERTSFWFEPLKNEEVESLSVVRTVLGDVAPEALGLCQTHEHITCDQRVSRIPNDNMVLVDEEKLTRELNRYYAAGGRAMVDVTTGDWGRNPERQARLSHATGVHIIATGGFYIEPHMPQLVWDWPIPRIVDWMLEEFHEGMDGTDIRIGLLKSGIAAGRIEGIERKGLRAVARAALETGLAITTHTSGSRRQEVPGGNLAAYHLEVLLEEGVSPTQLINGHTDERPDIGFLSELCELGCYIQFDVLGKTHWLLDETRVDLLKELIRRGHVGHILLGTDRCTQDELYPELGGLGYVYLLESFRPLMIKMGLEEKDIHQMLAVNPGNALGVNL